MKLFHIQKKAPFPSLKLTNKACGINKDDFFLKSRDTISTTFKTIKMIIQFLRAKTKSLVTNLQDAIKYVETSLTSKLKDHDATLEDTPYNHTQFISKALSVQNFQNEDSQQPHQHQFSTSQQPQS